MSSIMLLRNIRHFRSLNGNLLSKLQCLIKIIILSRNIKITLLLKNVLKKILISSKINFSLLIRKKAPF